MVLSEKSWLKMEFWLKNVKSTGGLFNKTFCQKNVKSKKSFVKIGSN